MSKPITRSKQEGLLIEPEGESNASSASTVTPVGYSNAALFTFLQRMQDQEKPRGTKCLGAILSRIGGDPSPFSI